MSIYTPLPPADLAAWLAVLRTPGIGPVTFAKLIAQFSNLRELFSLSTPDLCKLGLNPVSCDYLQNPDWTSVDSDLRWAEQANNHLITWQDPLYPTLLKEILSAPPILYVQGNPHYLTRSQIAMVGSRNPSQTGLETASHFAVHLARYGFTITSGLAIGIDTASHKGALDAEQSTIAVLATGIDCIYPERHKGLAMRIAEQGALVSEFPLGTKPLAAHFPQRNRIISGLSLGTLIVEAALKSGSLITARYAAEQGREVFAIPSSIHNPLARGCHALIRQGAKLVETAEDILEELGSLLEFVETKPHSIPQVQHLTSSQQHILNCIGFENTALGTLIQRTGSSPEQLATELLQLELAGYIIRAAGGYCRVVPKG